MLNGRSLLRHIDNSRNARCRTELHFSTPHFMQRILTHGHDNLIIAFAFRFIKSNPIRITCDGPCFITFNGNHLVFACTNELKFIRRDGKEMLWVLSAGIFSTRVLSRRCALLTYSQRSRVVFSSSTNLHATTLFSGVGLCNNRKRSTTIARSGRNREPVRCRTNVPIAIRLQFNRVVSAFGSNAQRLNAKRHFDGFTAAHKETCRSCNKQEKM